MKDVKAYLAVYVHYVLTYNKSITCSLVFIVQPMIERENKA